MWNEHASFIIHNKYADNTSSTLLQWQFGDDKLCRDTGSVKEQNRKALAQ